MNSPFEKLAAQLLDILVSTEHVALDEEVDVLLVDKLRDDLADFLAGKAGDPEVGARLGDWLIDQPAIEDVFAGDDELASDLGEALTRLESAPDETAAEPEPDDELVPISATDFFAEGSPFDDADDESEPGLDDGMIASLLRRWGRPSFRPVVATERGEPLDGKFGGAPHLPETESWPRCADRDEPMQFFVQLDLAALPAELGYPHRSGLIQLFFCPDPTATPEISGRAGSKHAVVRWLPAPARGRAAEVPKNQGPPHRDEDWVPHRIESWEALPPELPAYAELEQDPEMKVEMLPGWSTLYDQDLVARPGDKIGGWPAWVADAVYPPCPICGEPTVPLIQLESNGLTGHEFGDMGCGHILQCATHPEGVVFVWAGH